MTPGTEIPPWLQLPLATARDRHWPHSNALIQSKERSPRPQPQFNHSQRVTAAWHRDALGARSPAAPHKPSRAMSHLEQHHFSACLPKGFVNHRGRSRGILAGPSLGQRAARTAVSARTGAAGVSNAAGPPLVSRSQDSAQPSIPARSPLSGRRLQGELLGSFGLVQRR